MPKKLFEKRPDIISQWDFAVNSEADPYSVDAWSKDVSYGWICTKGHSWHATAYTRSSGENCIACLRQLGSLTLKSYSFMEEWNPSNGPIESYTHVSKDKVQWDCMDCGNSWTSMLYSRIKGAAKCPYCSGKQLSVLDFSVIVDLLFSSFSKNNECTLGELREEWKKKKVLWDCEDEDHSYDMTIEKRFQSKRCPYCANRRLLVGFNDLPSALPEVYLEWSPNNTLDPHTLLVSSREVVLWICSRTDCKREWKTSVEHRRDGSGCPSCNNRGPRLVQLKDSLGENSKLAPYWDESSNTYPPEAIGKGSHQLVSLICPLGHRWKRPAREVSRENGERCPYCHGYLVLKGFNDLETIHPELAAQWHKEKNEDKNPGDFLPNSYERAWWICDNGHSFSRVIAYRTKYYSDCFYCLGGKSKLEVEVLNFLLTEFPELGIVSGDKSLLDPYEVDILIPEKHIAIEVNGEYWHSNGILAGAVAFGGSEGYHKNKVELASEKGVKLGFLWEHDWLTDRKAAENMLINLVSEGNVGEALKRLKSKFDF